MATVLRRTLLHGSQGCNIQLLPRLITASPPQSCNVLGSVSIIPNRTKISKSSPFGKRPNPKVAQRDDYLKKNPNIKDMIGKNKSSQAPVIIDSTGAVVSNYIPLQKKAFILTPTGLMQRWDAFKNGLWTVYSLAFIKKYCKPFKLRLFAEEAQGIYIGVNKALVTKDKKKLEQLATGSVYHALKKEFFPNNMQLHWRFVKQVDRPRVVHARVVPVDSKQNLFAQVTVKINSEQVMAVKNQHGHHLKGSDKFVKKLTDYIVLERHLPNKYGCWRVCGKVFQPTQETQPVTVLPTSTQPST